MSSLQGSVHRRHLIARGFSVVTLVALLALTGLAFAPRPGHAQVARTPAPLKFDSSAEERRFQHLVEELRCVMCQNQSLADSDAMIAQDLRREVLELMREGRTDDEVRAFLVDRYGQFVLYRPAVRAHTWLLWFGPLVFLIGGGVAVALLVRARARASAPAVLEDSKDQEW